MNIILTAGKATRLGHHAPLGCKALTRFRGRPMIEHQLEVLGEATIVCRWEHESDLRRFGPTVVDNSLGGPVHALYTGLLKNEPTTVVYADSFFTHLPEEEEWCATGTVTGSYISETVYKDGVMRSGDRCWDVVTDESRLRPGGNVSYTTIPGGRTARVCSGMYRFADPFRLLRVLGELPEGNMGYVLSKYPLPFIEEPSWRDVGDIDALIAASWEGPGALAEGSVALGLRTVPTDARVVMAQEQT